MTVQTVPLHERDDAIITCAQCGRTKSIRRPRQQWQFQRPLRVKCSCGERFEVRTTEAEQTSSPRAEDGLQRLASTGGLRVTQIMEGGEILTGFETKNRYTIADDADATVLYKAVEGGNETFLGRLRAIFMRNVLRRWRPFTIDILADNCQVAVHVLQLQRPFRFFLHELHVFDMQGVLIGTIRRRFAVFRRLYTVSGRGTRGTFDLVGPLWRPWTFEIRHHDKVYGKITKKWGGVLREMFTDADTFGVTFPNEWDVTMKALFVGAIFLIDFVHFER